MTVQVTSLIKALKNITVRQTVGILADIEVEWCVFFWFCTNVLKTQFCTQSYMGVQHIEEHYFKNRLNWYKTAGVFEFGNGRVFKDWKVNPEENLHEVWCQTEMAGHLPDEMDILEWEFQDQ